MRLFRACSSNNKFVIVVSYVVVPVYRRIYDVCTKENFSIRNHVPTLNAKIIVKGYNQPPLDAAPARKLAKRTAATGVLTTH